MIKPQAPKGFRDILAADARARQVVAQKVREVFERFGFEPLETPTIEYASVILGKYGKEADRLVFRFTDRGERELALRYDQTVPTARILVEYANKLPRYWRRYQIQNVFRAEKPQKGRYREFTQCDIDIFGSTSPIADAEIIACTYFAYKNVGYPTVTVPLNDRQILFSNLTPYASEKVNVFSLIQSVDKFEKIGEDGVISELVKKGLAVESAKQALIAIKGVKPTQTLQTIIEYSVSLGVPKEALVFSPTLARGLDYYTNMIFEIMVPEYGSGSLGGGGRYDKLIEQLGGNPTPAVGIAFGFDRMVEAAQQLNLIPQGDTSVIIFVTIFDEKSQQMSLTIASKLRNAGIATEIFPDVDKLDKQLKYADKKGIPYVLIQGPEEVKRGVVKLKNMATKEQEELAIESVIDKLTAAS
ncbi:MAG: Histidine-tRNA ligase [Microgenomates group bacterium GW2011_GWC1_49_7]|nr:MAG: Histidine-tRNA ligase [Microgenomates group bacterium GW2011_GWC1_49_7]